MQCVDLGSGVYLAVLGALLIIAEYYWLVGMHFCSPTLHMGIQYPCEVIMNNSWISLNFSWILFMKCSWNIHEDPMNLLDIFKSINQAKQLLSVLLWWSMVPLSKLWMPYSIWLKTWIKFNNWKVVAECSGDLRTCIYVVILSKLCKEDISLLQTLSSEMMQMMRKKQAFKKICKT